MIASVPLKGIFTYSSSLTPSSLFLPPCELHEFRSFTVFYTSQHGVLLHLSPKQYQHKPSSHSSSEFSETMRLHEQTFVPSEVNISGMLPHDRELTNSYAFLFYLLMPFKVIILDFVFSYYELMMFDRLRLLHAAILEFCWSSNHQRLAWWSHSICIP